MKDLKKFNNFLSENNDSRQPKKLFKSTIKIDIISEDKIDFSALDLSDINYMITDGDCSGKIDYEKTNNVIIGKEAADEVKKQGSDTSFFMMDDEGFELED